MKTKLPTNNAVSIFICDDIRRELDGRVSLMGVFPGRSINLPAPADGEKRELPRLGIYIEVTGGQGLVDAAISIVAPDGRQIHEAELPGLQLRSGAPSAILGQIGGTEFSRDGEYQINLTMDGKRTYSRAIRISSASS